MENAGGTPWQEKKATEECRNASGKHVETHYRTASRSASETYNSLKMLKSGDKVRFPAFFT